MGPTERLRLALCRWPGIEWVNMFEWSSLHGITAPLLYFESNRFPLGRAKCRFHPHGVVIRMVDASLSLPQSRKLGPVHTGTHNNTVEIGISESIFDSPQSHMAINQTISRRSEPCDLCTISKGGSIVELAPRILLTSLLKCEKRDKIIVCVRITAPAFPYCLFTSVPLALCDWLATWLYTLSGSQKTALWRAESRPCGRQRAPERLFMR
jgi:hypothetical protein